MAKKVTKKHKKAAKSAPAHKAKSKVVKAAKPAPKAKPIAKIKKAKTKVVKAAKPAKSPKAAKPVKATKPEKVVKPLKSAKTRKSAKQPLRPPAVTTHSGPARKFPKPLFPIKGPKPAFVPEPSASTESAKKQSLNKKFLEQQKHKILELRDHLLDQMQGVAKDNLRSRAEGSDASAFGMHQADAGSDAYEKDFALSLLSQEQDALYEIEEALKRIELGGYGICEMSGKTIPISRLEAIPFARFTRECQEQAEKEAKGKNRWDTAAQFMDSTDNFFEEEEEGDEEEKPKLKE
jgi:DnaK suppressor protein